MHTYHVEITEAITETRSLTVEAETPEQAHRIAYRKWMEDGESDGDPCISIDDRTFTVTAADGSLHDFQNADFQDTPV